MGETTGETCVSMESEAKRKGSLWSCSKSITFFRPQQKRPSMRARWDGNAEGFAVLYMLALESNQILAVYTHFSDTRYTGPSMPLTLSLRQRKSWVKMQFVYVHFDS